MENKKTFKKLKMLIKAFFIKKVKNIKNIFNIYKTKCGLRMTYLVIAANKVSAR